MIACCGLDCTQCEAFIATRTGDDALRAKVAAEWARRTGAPIRPEHINCAGCRSAGPKTFYCEHLCRVRQCATARALASCADCADYPCAPLDDILRTAPLAKARLDSLHPASSRSGPPRTKYKHHPASASAPRPTTGQPSTDPRPPPP